MADYNLYPDINQKTQVLDLNLTSTETHNVYLYNTHLFSKMNIRFFQDVAGGDSDLFFYLCGVDANGDLLNYAVASKDRYGAATSATNIGTAHQARQFTEMDWTVTKIQYFFQTLPASGNINIYITLTK